MDSHAILIVSNKTDITQFTRKLGSKKITGKFAREQYFTCNHTHFKLHVWSYCHATLRAKYS